MVLTVSFALSPVTGLFCHRRPRTNVVPKPGRADITSANLTPASGRQDHTTSPYAAASFVSSPFDRSRAFRQPALQPRCAPNAAASTASLPASVTIAIRPSGGVGCESCRFDLGWVKTEIFLQTGLDTKLPDGQITALRALHSCPGRGAAYFTPLRRAGTHRRASGAMAVILGVQTIIAQIQQMLGPRHIRSRLPRHTTPAQTRELLAASNH